GQRPAILTRPLAPASEEDAEEDEPGEDGPDDLRVAELEGTAVLDGPGPSDHERERERHEAGPEPDPSDAFERGQRREEDEEPPEAFLLQLVVLDEVEEAGGGGDRKPLETQDRQGDVQDEADALKVEWGRSRLDAEYDGRPLKHDHEGQ